MSRVEPGSGRRDSASHPSAVLDPPLDPTPVEAQLRAALAEAVERPELPRVVVLFGETGRGKTYAVQRLFDGLADETPGFWRPCLTPAWPPTSRRQVSRDRKRVQPELPAASDAEPPYYWLAVGAAPSEGAAVVEMSAVLERQMHQQYATTLARSRRRGAAGMEALSAALDSLAAFLPPVGLGKAVVEHGVAIGRLMRGDTDADAERRSAVHSAFRRTLRERGGSTPTIVVLDDAQNVSPQTLELVSGLVAESTDGAGAAAGAPRQFLPPTIGTTLPGPLLIVCTVWEHRLAGTFEDPFRTWLDELASLGVDVSWVPCQEISPSDADRMCATWDIDPAGRDDFLQHVRRPGEGGTVNQLVLAAGVGHLEEMRDPLSHELTVPREVVDKVAQLPEQHLRDRLELVREQPAGALALALLRAAVEVGPVPPRRLLHELTSGVDPDLAGSAEALLADHRLAAASIEGPATADALVIDPDIHRLLLRDALLPVQSERLRAACARLMSGLTHEVLADELAGPGLVSIPRVLQMYEPAAAMVLDGTPCEDVDASVRVVACAVHGRPVAGGDLAACDDAAYGFAYFTGSLPGGDPARLLGACAHFGEARLTARIAGRALSTERGRLDATREEEFLGVLRSGARHTLFAHTLAQALVERARVQEAIDVLRALDDTTPWVAHQIARLELKRGRSREAVEMLRPLTGELGAAAMTLAEALVRDGRRDEAIEMLRPLVERHNQVPLKLADLLVTAGRADEAVALLTPLVDTDQDIAPRLADLLVSEGRTEEAVAMLRQVVDIFQDVPAKLADVLTAAGRADEAEQVLVAATRRFPVRASDALARWLLRRGERDRAIDVLRDLAAVDANALALGLKLLLEDRRFDEAIELGLPGAHRASNAATTLADLLIQAGRMEDALDLLEKASVHAMNPAIKLAKLVRVSDPERAASVLRPWSFAPGAAGMLAGVLLRQGDLAGAIALVDPVPQVNEKQRAQLVGLATAARLLGSDEQVIASLRAERTPVLYSVFGALYDCDRPDLVAAVVAELTQSRAHRVAADLFLNLAQVRVRTRGDADLRATAHEIWPTPALVGVARRTLQGSLWAWVRQPRSVRPPMSPAAALSCIEALLALGPGGRPLRTAVVTALVAAASESAPVYARLTNVALFSGVADEVLSRADLPPDWRREP